MCGLVYDIAFPTLTMDHFPIKSYSITIKSPCLLVKSLFSSLEHAAHMPESPSLCDLFCHIPHLRWSDTTFYRSHENTLYPVDRMLHLYDDICGKQRFLGPDPI